ncbi:MAG: hypothetical protein ACI81L_000660 [Verrucomicrobiales bacterium]
MGHGTSEPLLNSSIKGQGFGDAMGAFMDDLGDLGHGESTLICTTSEFGRRVPDNRGGTDHGAAGMAMLAGPVNAGVHGGAPSLRNLDDDNLKATIDLEEYYATIAEQWFGIPSSEMLESGATPIDGLIAAVRSRRSDLQSHWVGAPHSPGSSEKHLRRRCNPLVKRRLLLPNPNELAGV